MVFLFTQLQDGIDILSKYHAEKFSKSMSCDLTYANASRILKELPENLALSSQIIPAIQIFTDSAGARVFFLPNTSSLMIRWKNGEYEEASSELIREAGFEEVLVKRLESYCRLMYKKFKEQWLLQKRYDSEFSVRDELDFACWYANWKGHNMTKEDLRKIFSDKFN